MPTSSAVAWTPTIDRVGVDEARYAKDLPECMEYARANPEADPSKAARDGAKKIGLGSAALLGLVGVASGGLAVLPMAAGTIALTGGAGALAGGARGKAVAEAKYRNIVANCLMGRGYKVLG